MARYRQRTSVSGSDIGPTKRTQTRRAIEDVDPTLRRRRRDNEIRRRANIQNFQEPEDKDRFYVVEALLDKKSDEHDGEYYFVKWLNYPDEYNTWEPRAELERNCRDMINQFNRIIDPNRSTREDLTHCVCNQPYRFDQGGMIQCFNCLRWYHFKCLKMNMEEANAYSCYNCDKCRKDNPNLKNSIKLEKQHLFLALNDDDDATDIDDD